jgi:hypothetical protein
MTQDYLKNSKIASLTRNIFFGHSGPKPPTLLTILGSGKHPTNRNDIKIRIVPLQNLLL